MLISGSADQSIKIIDINNRNEIHCFKDAHKDVISSVAISPNGKFIVSASNDKSIKIFDVINKQELHNFQNIHKKEIVSIEFGSSGRLFFTGSADGSIKVFDLSIKQEVHHFPNAHDGRLLVKTYSNQNLDPITSIALARNKGYIVSASFDRSLKVFTIESKQEDFCIPDAHKGINLSIASMIKMNRRSK